MMRRMNPLALLIMAELSLGACGDEQADKMWGSESDDPSGLVVKYRVAGSSSGEPLAGVLIRYLRTDKVQPQFASEFRSTGAGTRDFIVNGKRVVYSGTFILFVNDAKGLARTISVPREWVARVFGEKASPPRKDLLKFWDDVVKAQLVE